MLKYLGVAATLACVAWLASCSAPRSLVVGLHPWVGYEPLYIARELKWLPESIRLRDDPTLGDSLAALQSGEEAAACMTLDEMLRARAAGIPLSAALVFDVSAGADAVMARPGIRTAGDLAHKRIAFDTHAVGALVFEKLIDSAGLPASAVITVDIPPDRQLAAWRRNEVDAVITYEPLATAFLREGAHSLLDSRDMPDTIIDVLAVRRDRTDLLPSLRALAASHFRALDYMRTNREDFLLRASAREGLTPEEARRMLAGVSFPSLAANRTYLTGRDAALPRAAKAISSLLVRRGILSREDSLDDLILPGVLPSEDR